MKAAFIEQTGDPGVIVYGELPRPVPQPGEVLVKVGASAVNPIDLYIRQGAIAMPLRFPFVPGCDLAGTVEMVGRGVRRFAVGDRVWGSNQGLFGRQGTASEYVCCDEKWLYPTPAAESDAEAAAGAIELHIDGFGELAVTVGDELNELGYNHMFTDMFNAFEAGKAPKETFYDGYVVNCILDAAYRSAKSKQWEPVLLEDWRGQEGVTRHSHLISYDAEHYLVKEEMTHYGAKKVILKHKETGKITEKVLSE
jgi:hypothetical protein